MDTRRILNCVVALFVVLYSSEQVFSIYVDHGVPYNNGPCKTAELVIGKTTENSPIHTVAHFPLEFGDFPVIIYIGGLASDVPAEFYSIFLQKLASHGFFIFGMDYNYPAIKSEGWRHKGDDSKSEGWRRQKEDNYGQDINTYLKGIEFLQTYMVGRTIGRPLWNTTGIMSHSAGGEIALKLLLLNKFTFKSSAFLEPFSNVAHTSKELSIPIPGLMYGTELSEKGITKCNIPGYDYQQFYKLWKCPKIAMEVADFGHCDFLDPLAWEACHVSHFCTTTNNTRLDQYRQFVQGVTASFFITTLQGRQDAIQYITNQTASPLKLLVDESDWKC